MSPVCAVLAIMVAGLSLLGFLHLRHERASLRQIVKHELETISDMKARQIASWRQEQMDLAGMYCQSASFLAREIQRLLDQSNAATSRKIELWMKLQRAGGHYQALVLVDSDLKPRLSVPQTSTPLDLPEAALLSDCLRSNRVILSDLRRQSRNHSACMDLVFPILPPSDSGTSSAPVAVLTALIDPQQALYGMIEWQDARHSSEEIVLVRAANGGLVSLSPSGSSTNLFVHLPPSAFAGFERAGSDAFETVDSRGTRVFAVVRRIPGSPWMLVVKLDVRDVFRPLDRRLWDGVLAMLVLLSGAGLVGGLARKRMSAIQRNRQESERERMLFTERMVLLTRHATDVMLLADESGVIIEANERAAQIYNRPVRELVGTRIEDLSAPAHRLDWRRNPPENSPDGIVYESMHQRRDGVTFPVEVIDRIADIAGQRLRLLLIREVTMRHKAMEDLRLSEERFARVFRKSPMAKFIVHLGNNRVSDVNEAFAILTGIRHEEIAQCDVQTLSFWNPPGELTRLLQEIRNSDSIQECHEQWRGRDGGLRDVLVSVEKLSFGDGDYALFLARDITMQRKTEEQLRLSYQRLRALAERDESIREQERIRISREVHDVLGQLLTGLKMDLAWLDRHLGGVADESLRQTMKEKNATTESLVDAIIEAVRKISTELRPSLLDNLGLVPAIRFECRQFQSRTGIPCEVVTPPIDTALLKTEQATGVFRVFQEILTNVVRHAKASRVEVSFTLCDGAFALEVSDNGRGISEDELNRPTSLGLLGMSERAVQMGGAIRIHGTPGKGTTVTLTIPVPGA